MAEFSVEQAEGVSLFDKIILNRIVFEKGHLLSAEDIAGLKSAGIYFISGVKITDAHLAADIALKQLAAKLCGDNTAYSVSGGECKIAASRDGIFAADVSRIIKFNSHSPEFILNSVPTYSYVKKNQVIAKIIMRAPYAEEKILNDILLFLSGNIALLNVVEAKPIKTALIYTNFYNNADEKKYFVAATKKIIKKFPHLNLSREYQTNHNVEDISNMVEKACKDGFGVIFVISARQTSSAEDTVPLALKSYADEIVNYSCSDVNAPDVIIAAKKKNKIISLPFNYAQTESTFADELILKSLAKGKLSSFDFKKDKTAFLESPQILEEKFLSNLIVSQSGSQKNNVAIIILAAGEGRRAKTNKLLSGKKDPLFLKSVNAAIKSACGPVFLITGYQADIMEEYVSDLDINIIRNQNYDSGVKGSIDLGLKSVPTFCEGAILLPADMPNITPQLLKKMSAALQKEKNKQVVLLTHKGIKHNPILWSKDLFEVAELVPEGSDIRPVLMAHNDYITEVEVKNEKEITDITFPSDL